MVCDAVIRASTVFSEDKKAVLRKAIEMETVSHARWVLETILENAEIAERTLRPTCDDTGIPHVLWRSEVVEVSVRRYCKPFSRALLPVCENYPVAMAVKGDVVQRLEQSVGLEGDPGALALAPIHGANQSKQRRSARAQRKHYRVGYFSAGGFATRQWCSYCVLAPLLLR